MSKVCKTTKNNGEPCQSPAIGDTGYCYFHNPEMASKRAESRKKGGLNRRAGKKSEHGPYSIRGSDRVYPGPKISFLSWYKCIGFFVLVLSYF